MNYEELWKFVHKHPWISYWLATTVVTSVTKCLTDIVTVLRTGEIPDRRTVINVPAVSTTTEVETAAEVEAPVEITEAEEVKEESEEAPEAE